MGFEHAGCELLHVDSYSDRRADEAIGASQPARCVATRWVQLARRSGVLPGLPLALNGRIAGCTFAGDLAAATSLIEEAQAVSEAIGSHVPPYGALFLAGRRGREAEATPLIEATVNEALDRGEGYAVSAAEWARALLYNGLERHEDALGAAERASAHPEDLWFHNFGLVELIEAAVRTGNASTRQAPSSGSRRSRAPVAPTRLGSRRARERR
jgi:hypothetical protein